MLLDAVIVTPEKLRTFVLDHYSRDYLTFETILNNLRSWTISRTYSSTGALDETISISVNEPLIVIKATS
jgi:hypothetical protein